jgi:phenylpyruvate tautomerase PptA (4-oxalocrotonate tautomerase family)
MPFIQVHSCRAVSPAVRSKLGFELAGLYASAMQTDHRIVNVGFSTYPPGGLARYGESDEDASEMTILTCDVRSGRTPEAIEAFGSALTALVAKALDVPEARVAVYVTQHDAHEIYRDGGRAPDWSAAEQRTPERE